VATKEGYKLLKKKENMVSGKVTSNVYDLTKSGKQRIDEVRTDPI
jgi:hypothetical protein